MTERNESVSDVFGDVEPVNEGDLDIDVFIDSMEQEDARCVRPRAPQRAAWQRLEDWRDARWLREQLDDWDDWEKGSG